MDFNRIKLDIKYILINKIIINIPSWTIRRIILQRFGLKIGKKSRIGIGTMIINPRGITIGDNTIVNENCYLDGRGGLYIANNVSISAFTKIITASHRLNDSNFSYYEESVTIENYVWIGFSALILNGSVLSEGSVISAGCVFKGKTEKNMIYIPTQEWRTRKRFDGPVECEIDYKAYFR